MSYNPNTGLTYIPAIEMAGVFKDKGMDLAGWKSPHFYIDPGVEFAEADTPKDYGTGSLLAWDPVKQKKVWEQPLPPNWNAGTMTTKGNLVFEGMADGNFHAFNATTGEKLWQVNVGSGISAAPITYTVDGKQYISVLVGWGGGGVLLGSLAAQHGWKYKVHPRRLFTFSLDGKAALPPSPPPAFAVPVDVPDLKIDTKLADKGKERYAQSCMWCHGTGAVAGGIGPDLRESPIATNPVSLKEVVVNGAKLANGMPRFGEFTEADINGLFHYIRQQARASVMAAKK